MSNLIGRDNEIGLIKAYINEMKSFHIYGHEGAGKTAILEYIFNHWDDLRSPLIPIFCRTSATLREILLRIAGFILYRTGNLQNIDKFKQIHQIRYQSDLKTVNSRDMKNIIFRNMKYKNFCVILDRLDYVTPKINALLVPLDEAAVLITSSRQSWEIADYSFRGKLDYCLYLFPKLRIGNLKRKDAFILMENLSSNMSVNFPNKPQTFEEIFHISKGNPRTIVEILDKAKQPQYVTGDSLNLNLIMIDCRIDNIGEGGHP